MNLRRAKVYVLGAVFLVLTEGRAFAPMFSMFPGLDSLISESQVIVVAEISGDGHGGGFGGEAEYPLTILKVLKGALKPRQATTASLRALPFVKGDVHERTILQTQIYKGGRFILFLVPARPKVTKATFEGTNSSGSTLWINPQCDLSLVAGQSGRVGIETLVRDTVEREKRAVRTLESIAEMYLSGGT